MMYSLLRVLWTLFSLHAVAAVPTAQNSAVFPPEDRPSDRPFYHEYEPPSPFPALDPQSYVGSSGDAKGRYSGTSPFDPAAPPQRRETPVTDPPLHEASSQTSVPEAEAKDEPSSKEAPSAPASSYADAAPPEPAPAYAPGKCPAPETPSTPNTAPAPAPVPASAPQPMPHGTDSASNQPPPPKDQSTQDWDYTAWRTRMESLLPSHHGSEPLSEEPEPENKTPPPSPAHHRANLDSRRLATSMECASYPQLSPGAQTLLKQSIDFSVCTAESVKEPDEEAGQSKETLPPLIHPTKEDCEIFIQFGPKTEAMLGYGPVDWQRCVTRTYYLPPASPQMCFQYYSSPAPPSVLALYDFSNCYVPAQETVFERENSLATYQALVAATQYGSGIEFSELLRTATLSAIVPLFVMTLVIVASVQQTPRLSQWARWTAIIMLLIMTFYNLYAMQQSKVIPTQGAYSAVHFMLLGRELLSLGYNSVSIWTLSTALHSMKPNTSTTPVIMLGVFVCMGIFIVSATHDYLSYLLLAFATMTGAFGAIIGRSDKYALDEEAHVVFHTTYSIIHISMYAIVPVLLLARFGDESAYGTWHSLAIVLLAITTCSYSRLFDPSYTTHALILELALPPPLYTLVGVLGPETRSVVLTIIAMLLHTAGTGLIRYISYPYLFHEDRAKKMSPDEAALLWSCFCTKALGTYENPPSATLTGGLAASAFRIVTLAYNFVPNLLFVCYYAVTLPGMREYYEVCATSRPRIPGTQRAGNQQRQPQQAGQASNTRNNRNTNNNNNNNQPNPTTTQGGSQQRANTAIVPTGLAINDHDDLNAKAPPGVEISSQDFHQMNATWKEIKTTVSMGSAAITSPHELCTVLHIFFSGPVPLNADGSVDCSNVNWTVTIDSHAHVPSTVRIFNCVCAAGHVDAVVFLTFSEPISSRVDFLPLYAGGDIDEVITSYGRYNQIKSISKVACDPFHPHLVRHGHPLPSGSSGLGISFVTPDGPFLGAIQVGYCKHDPNNGYALYIDHDEEHDPLSDDVLIVPTGKALGRPRPAGTPPPTTITTSTPTAVPGVAPTTTSAPVPATKATSPLATTPVPTPFVPPANPHKVGTWEHKTFGQRNKLLADVPLSQRIRLERFLKRIENHHQQRVSTLERRLSRHTTTTPQSGDARRSTRDKSPKRPHITCFCKDPEPHPYCVRCTICTKFHRGPCPKAVSFTPETKSST